MGIVEAIVLGLIQGLTEFLPISSTAHIRVLPALLGWADPGAGFTAAIQVGTLAAVLAYFWKDLAAAFMGWLRSFKAGSDRTTPEARLGWAIVVGTVPVIVLGLLFKDAIETQLRSLQVVAWALIGMGLVLLAAEAVGKRKREVADAKWPDGLWVGLWQAAALVPGASRSGSTIAGALFAGFDRAAAARFSFLLSVPSVFAAAVFSLARHRHELLGAEMAPMVIANVVSFVSGYASIAFLIRFLQKHGTAVFVVYRIALGAAILWLVSTGKL